jgi:hypothetical protein
VHVEGGHGHDQIQFAHHQTHQMNPTPARCGEHITTQLKEIFMTQQASQKPLVGWISEGELKWENLVINRLNDRDAGADEGREQAMSVRPQTHTHQKARKGKS